MLFRSCRERGRCTVKDTSKTSLRRGHNEGNIRQRTDGRWEVRLSAGIDYKTGKPRRTSTCCNTRQEAIAILQQQAHEVRTQGWRDPMSVTLGEWYEYWLDTYMKDTVKQSTYASYRSYLNYHISSIRNCNGNCMPLVIDRKSTRLNSSHANESRMPSSA